MVPAIWRCGRHVDAGMFHNGLIGSLLLNVWVSFQNVADFLDISSVTFCPAEAKLAIIV